MVQVQGGHVSQLSRSATARRGELGSEAASTRGPFGLVRAGAVRQVVPVVIVVSCGRGGLSAGRGERLCGSGGREAACSSVVAALDA
jgi:hypothetical protein